MIGIALLPLLGLLPQFGKQDRPHSVQSGPGYQIQGVAFTHTIDGRKDSPIALEASIRVRGKLKENDHWFLRILRVTATDGSKLPVNQPMIGGLSPMSLGTVVTAFSPIRGDGAISAVRLEGELVHTFAVREDAVFPTVNLKLIGGSHKAPDPPMRNWTLPENTKYESQTARGVRLRSATMTGYGYSGPGYADLAIIPLEIDRSTLNKGIE